MVMPACACTACLQLEPLAALRYMHDNWSWAHRTMRLSMLPAAGAATLAALLATTTHTCLTTQAQQQAASTSSAACGVGGHAPIAGDRDELAVLYFALAGLARRGAGSSGGCGGGKAGSGGGGPELCTSALLTAVERRLTAAAS